MNRADFQRLSRLRTQEARSLLRTKHPSGAYYLSGYGVECTLKACIAKETRRFDFPEKERVVKSYSHNLIGLAQLADLLGDVQQAAQANIQFDRRWNIVKAWSEQSRYQVWTMDEAHAMIDAVTHRRDGILPWLVHFW